MKPLITVTAFSWYDALETLVLFPILFTALFFAAIHIANA